MLGAAWIPATSAGMTVAPVESVPCEPEDSSSRLRGNDIRGAQHALNWRMPAEAGTQDTSTSRVSANSLIERDNGGPVPTMPVGPTFFSIHNLDKCSLAGS